MTGTAGGCNCKQDASPHTDWWVKDAPYTTCVCDWTTYHRKESGGNCVCPLYSTSDSTGHCILDDTTAYVWDNTNKRAVCNTNYYASSADGACVLCVVTSPTANNRIVGPSTGTAITNYGS